jgi:two-component system, NarL family, nitrate/nitrite sensor histidine kinase NarX
LRLKMKPRIKLAGGSAAAVMREAQSCQKPASRNDVVMSKSSAIAGVLLQPFLDNIIHATGASAGIVRVLSPDGLMLRTAGRSGMSAETCKCDLVVDADCGICGKSLAGKAVESSDTEYCRNRYGEGFFGSSCNHVVATPLDEGGAIHGLQGVLTLFFAEPVPVNEDMSQRLSSYAGLVRIALENIWHNEDHHQQELLAERQAIANEIHDSLAQTLYFAKMRSSLLLEAVKTKNDLMAYKCAQDVEEALSNSQKTVRELVTHFRCQMDPRGLRHALEKLVHDIEARSGIRLEYVNRIDNFRLPQEIEIQVFLIIREAFVNIASHSGANIARLTVWQEAGRYHFEVEDNGNGVSGDAPSEGHYGLAIMRERAMRIGGEVALESLQGRGARVSLQFAVPADMPA